VTSDPSLTEMTELDAFPAFGRGSTLKMRYALEEVVVAEAAAAVARRMDAMLKFMVDSDVEMYQVVDKQIYELLMLSKIARSFLRKTRLRFLLVPDK
jgi:hypothetical protein